MIDTKTEQTDIGSARHVCPPKHIRSMDNYLRTVIHNPRKLFGRHVREGMTVLDVGCGGGWATEGLAELVGPTGRVIAADLQPEMLALVSVRMKRGGLADRVRLHQCRADHVGVTRNVDFAVAFWMAHETPNVGAFLAEVREHLTTGGRLFVAEPFGHVSKKDFERTVELAREVGLSLIERPRVLLSRAVVLENP